MNTQHGVTLIELIVGIAVAAILMAVAVPSWTAVVQANRAVAEANELVGALQLARSEAVKRGMRVSVCASANPTVASPTCSGSGNWSTGWIVFTDNTGTTGTKDGTDALIKIWDGISSGSSLVATDTAGTPAAAPNAQFLGTGFSAAARVFTLTPNGCSNSNKRTISLSPQGRTDVVKTSC